MAKIILNLNRNQGQREKESLTKDGKILPAWFLTLPVHLRSLVEKGIGIEMDGIEEIRLRIGRPLVFRSREAELTIDPAGWPTAELSQGVVITRADLDRTLQNLSQGSLYAWEDEFKNGFLTLPGGHRVGLVGRGVLDKGSLKTLKDISGLNFRIGHEVLGCADEVMPYLFRGRQVLHTLIISPPQCGKTTLLRDMVRQFSDGMRTLRFNGVNVGLVDERSEIAGMYLGEPQFAIGLRTDVLDACPKALGMMMLIRSMSPAVIATDEIGKMEDIEALTQVLQAGVSVVTTVHGDCYEDICKRPVLRDLLDWQFFERIVVLSRREGAGTLEAILDGKTRERVKKIC